MIELKELSLGYGERKLLDKISVYLQSGQLIALLGRNGTGKSTLLRALMGMETPQHGHIILDGQALTDLSAEERARKISLVTTDKIRIAHLNCQEVVSLGRSPYTNWLGKLRAEDLQLVKNAMKLVGMEKYATQNMNHLSDGECQRIMIARALAQDTPIILLDEPTAFLDLPNRYELCFLLRKLAHEQGKCILFSTHELDIAFSVCDFIMLIDSPQLHALPTAEMIDSGHIERLFHFQKSYFFSKPAAF